MSRCRYCRDPITWAITDAGRRMPLNLGPDPAGNVVVTGGTDSGGLRVRVLTDAERLGTLLEAPHPGPRYMPHAATCKEKP